MSAAEATGGSRQGAVGSPGAGSFVVRRFAGPRATELAVRWRPAPDVRDPVRQADAAYRAVLAALGADGTPCRALTDETLFVRNAERDLPLVLAARARVLADAGEERVAPRPACIVQPPVAPGASFELLASAVIARGPAAPSVQDIPAASACACEGCVRAGARVLRLGDETRVYAANIHGTGSGPYEEAFDMFQEAERLLERCGLGFRDVVRAWVYLRDIDRDYDVLNRARRAFFEARGIALRPASTGIQGAPIAAQHGFALRVHAVRTAGPRQVAPMSTPTLNEAWTYGADFSRGLRVAGANAIALHVSGTASIDEAGRTAHAGDLAGQVGRMLANIRTLLDGAGATFRDILSGVVYVKRAADAPAVEALLAAEGFGDFPCAMVEAPLCRPELLCEAEAVAALPLSAGTA